MSLFRRNRQLEHELAGDSEFRHGLAQAAGAARDQAATFARQAKAPWMTRAEADATIVVDEAPDGVRLVSTDYGGHLMEWGGRNNPPHAPLRRGVRAAGLRLEEQSK